MEIATKIKFLDRSYKGGVSLFRLDENPIYTERLMMQCVNIRRMSKSLDELRYGVENDARFFEYLQIISSLESFASKLFTTLEVGDPHGVDIEKSLEIKNKVDKGFKLRESIRDLILNSERDERELFLLLNKLDTKQKEWLAHLLSGSTEGKQKLGAAKSDNKGTNRFEKVVEVSEELKKKALVPKCLSVLQRR